MLEKSVCSVVIALVWKSNNALNTSSLHKCNCQKKFLPCLVTLLMHSIYKIQQAKHSAMQDIAGYHTMLNMLSSHRIVPRNLWLNINIKKLHNVHKNTNVSFVQKMKLFFMHYISNCFGPHTNLIYPILTSSIKTISRFYLSNCFLM